MNHWKWDDVWNCFGVVVGATVLALLIAVFVAPKNVDYYYLEGGSSLGVCVEQHWTWHVDRYAFCTDDITKAVDVLQKANAAIQKRP